MKLDEAKQILKKNGYELTMDEGFAELAKKAYSSIFKKNPAHIENSEPEEKMDYDTYLSIIKTELIQNYECNEKMASRIINDYKDTVIKIRYYQDVDPKAVAEEVEDRWFDPTSNWTTRDWQEFGTDNLKQVVSKFNENA